MSNSASHDSCVLRDVCDLVQYGYTASASAEEIGPKFLRITDIVPDLIDWQRVPYCEIVPKQSGKYLLRHGDIVVARTGATTGYAKLLKHPPEAVFASYLVRLRIKQGVDSGFIGAIVQSATYKRFIAANIGGAAQPNANAQVLTSFPISLPPLAEQRRIAAILAAYDDLIENNTRRIAILEEMARRIYEEWFVHFRFPGHEQVRMVESELGSVPEGWVWTRLDELYRTASGGTPSRKRPEYFDGDTPWVKTRELDDRFIFRTEETITNTAVKNSSAKVFPAGTVLIAMYGATIGKLGILAVPAATNQACCAVISKDRDFEAAYAYLTLLTRRQELIDLRAGAAQQNINQITVRAFPMIRPNSAVLGSFNRLVTPQLELAANLQQQNVSLRTTRDLLLPRLISGELDVSALPEPEAVAA